MQKEKAAKFVALIIFGTAQVIFVSQCCGAPAPKTQTPLYKYLAGTRKTLITEESQSKGQQIQQANLQEKTEAANDKISKPSSISPDRPASKPEKETIRKPTDNQTNKSARVQLNTGSGLSAIRPEMPFSEAVDNFRNLANPPLNIVVLWKDIEENSDVDRHTPVGIEPFPGVSFAKNLELMLMSVSGDPKTLGYTVDKGVITIATQNFLSRKMETRVYDTLDLLGAPANFFGIPRAQIFNYGMPQSGYGGYGGGGYGNYGGSGYGTSGYGGGYGLGGFGYSSPSIMSGYGTNAGGISAGGGFALSPSHNRSAGYSRSRKPAGFAGGAAR
jgi:hypothetical protein